MSHSSMLSPSKPKSGFFGRLRVQLILAMAALMLGYAILSAALFSSSFVQLQRAELRTSSLLMAETLASTIRQQMKSRNAPAVKKVLTEVQSIYDLKFASAQDISGLFHVHALGEEMSEVPHESEFLQTTLANGQKKVRFENNFFDVAVPVSLESRTIGAIFMRKALPTFWETLLPNLTKELFAFIPFFIFGAGLIYFMTDKVVKPLERMTKSATKIADGEWQFNEQKAGYHEIETLNHALSSMSSELKQNFHEIKRLAFEDTVTGLANRARFEKTLEGLAKRANVSGNKMALFFIGLDHFKRINETLGHEVGDRLLKEIGQRIEDVVRCRDPLAHHIRKLIPDCQEIKVGDELKDATDGTSIARVGGDEFTLLISNLPHSSDAAKIAERILAVLSEPFEVDGQSIGVQASIGISMFPSDGKKPSKLLRAADLAMCRAKKNGRNTYSFFAPEMDFIAQDRMQLELDLRQAIECGEINVHFQPKVDFKTRKVLGVEALARWHHKDRGYIPPLEFIPIAEECGMISDLGELVLKKALAFGAKLHKCGNSITVAVNVSPSQFDDPSFGATVMNCLKEADMPANLLELEITEQVALSNPARTQEQIEPLQKQGVRFAIDDFGTGYSNLAQLNKISFDVFKIDRSFVSTLVNRHDSRVIANTITAMAKDLNYATVAEGVETEAQAEILGQIGCRIGQGFLFGKAMRETEFLSWMLTYTAQPIEASIIYEDDDEEAIAAS